MDRATFKLVMAIGILLNSALYLSGVVIAGLVVGSGFAWRFGLLALAITYASYICHFVGSDDPDAPKIQQACQAWAAPLVWASVWFGAIAGVILLFG